MSEPSAAALRAAKAVEEYCDTVMWEAKGTAFVASLIDRETGLPELLEALEVFCAAYEALDESVAEASHTKLWNFDTAQALIPGRTALFKANEQARAAIQKATGGTDG